MTCIVSKRYILLQKCMNNWIGSAILGTWLYNSQPPTDPEPWNSLPPKFHVNNTSYLFIVLFMWIWLTFSVRGPSLRRPNSDTACTKVVSATAVFNYVTLTIRYDSIISVLLNPLLFVTYWTVYRLPRSTGSHCESVKQCIIVECPVSPHSTTFNSVNKRSMIAYLSNSWVSCSNDVTDASFTAVLHAMCYGQK